MAQAFLFFLLIILGHIILIMVYLRELRTERSNQHRLALIFSLGMAITVLISFFVPMLLYSNGYISPTMIFVGFTSATIWLVFGYPVARVLEKLKKRG